jgi:glycosyltransferase involved in cell wall biosynthesis
MNNPLKIFLTIDYSPWSAYNGGAQNSTHQIASHLAQIGHDVTVIFSKPPWERIKVPGELPYKLEWASLFALKSTRKSTFRFLTPYSVNRIILKNSHPDQHFIVHSNGEEGGLIHKLRSKRSFGFISTPRHPHYPDFYRIKNPTLVQKTFHLIRNAKYEMQRSAAVSADFCSPPSFWAGDELKHLFSIPDHKIRPVHNGVNPPFLKVHNIYSDKTGPILFFGRLSATKGVDVLIEAYSNLETDSKPGLIIIGRGELQSRLKNRVTELGLEQQITFIPWISHEELGDYLKTASMAVLPSREENFSLAVLEALCSGTPVISTEVGGTAEMISDGENGLLVPPSDTDALSNAMKRLIVDRNFAKTIGQNGSETVREKFTWQKTVEKFEALYRKALEKHV